MLRQICEQDSRWDSRKQFLQVPKKEKKPSIREFRVHVVEQNCGITKEELHSPKDVKNLLLSKNETTSHLT